MDLLRPWMALVAANQWVVAGLIAGLSILVLAFLLRSAVYVARFGFVNWLKSTFQIQGESWRLIGILLLLMMAAAMVFTQWL
jgi:predicted membrane-bound dolichyl-phosphate-mannose-protein mannosyltransferase